MKDAESRSMHQQTPKVEKNDSILHQRSAHDFWSQNDPFNDLLTKRADVCTNAFGDGWLSSICAPGRTLCCVNEKQSYPQCQQHMGLGWCCTEADQGCYVDLTSSACGQPGAVQCTELGPGVDEACCPQYTTCAPGYNATDSYVRCDIQELALEALTPSAISSIEDAIKPTDSASISQSQSSKSSGTVSSSSTGSTAVNLSTDISSSVTQATQTTSSSSSETFGPASITNTDAAPAQETEPTQPTPASGLATGTMVGIILGAVAVGAILAMSLWLVWRKRRRNKKKSAENNQLYPEDKPPSAGAYGRDKDQEPYALYYRNEMDDTRRQELWGGQISPKEMQTREVAELEGSAK